MTAFQDFVNAELPLRVSIGTSPGAVRYPRFTGVGKAVEARTAAQFLSDIGGGDVTGPASATNNALARFDTTTGKLIQDSLAILGDTGIFTGLIELIVPLISNAATMDIKTTAGNGNIVLTAHGTGIVAIDNGTTVPAMQFGVFGDSPELRFTNASRTLRWDDGDARFEFSKLLLIIGANNLLIDGSALSAQTTNADLTVKANGTGNFAIINPGSAIQMILDVDAVATSNKTFTFLNENMTPVGVSNTQTLTDKTLTAPVIARITSAAHVDVEPASGSEFRIKDTAGSNYVGFDVTAIASTDRTITIPDGDVTLVPGTMVATTRTVSAGTGMTGGGDLSVNRTLTLATAQRTRTNVLYIEDPIATDVFPIMFTKDAITITKIYGIVDAATSVSFSLWHRAFANTFTGASETQINDDTNDPLVATVTGDTTIDFDPGDATVPAESTISYKASAISGSPLKIMVAISYTVD